MWQFSDLWPCSTNREDILGEFTSAKLVGKGSQGINPVMLSGAMVVSSTFRQDRRYYLCDTPCSAIPSRWAPSLIYFSSGGRQRAQKAIREAQHERPQHPDKNRAIGLGSRLPRTRPEFLDFPENRSGKEQVVFSGEGRREPIHVSCSRATQTCTGPTLGLP